MTEVPAHPPGAWPRGVALASRLRQPLQRFLHIQSASGIVLLVAAVVALVWANSPWAHAYHALWEAPVSIGVGPWSASSSLHFIVNDILMAVFFFVVGLEIRREMHRGELSDLRRASLPIVAAIGGMLVPAVLYASVSSAGDAMRGWGVPMATDIAFAVGILALLGSRVPPSLRVLLLALAIIDDIGAILVIAVFYSDGIELAGIGLAVGSVALILGLQRFGVRSVVAYVVPAVLVWSGVLWAGIHPTIAGVIVGLLTPVRPWYRHGQFVEQARETIDVVEQAGRASLHAVAGSLSELGRARREVISPVERIEAALHPWVAFGIMPIFALANAGVDLGGVDFATAPGVAIGIGLGLVVGKLAGVVLASFVAVKLGMTALPRGVTWRGLFVVGAVAGVGFTMALFIAGLAFESRPDLHAIAKLAVLVASGVAAVLTMVLGRMFLPRHPVPGAALSEDEAESSTAR